MISHWEWRHLRLWRTLLVAAALTPGAVPRADAQSFDQVGTRAKGMGGAFVAVADDATATWWNPAGVPNSFVVDAVLDFQTSGFTDNGPVPPGKSPGTRNGVAGFAFCFPAVGLSYYRVRQTGIEPATAATLPGRQDPATGPLARSLLTEQVGVSLVQSLGDSLVVGATLRVVHGGVSTAPGVPGDVDAGLDAAAEADGPTRTTGDVDVGAVLHVKRLRLALAARNLAAPDFPASDGISWRIDRVVRVGMAVVDGHGAGRQDWTVSADADLTRESTPFGDRRDVAFGAERWIAHRRVGVRGGLRVSTVDDARTAVSGGASVGLISGVWVEAQATGGADRTTRGWGIDAHVMF